MAESCAWSLLEISFLMFRRPSGFVPAYFINVEPEHGGNPGFSGNEATYKKLIQGWTSVRSSRFAPKHARKL